MPCRDFRAPTRRCLRRFLSAPSARLPPAREAYAATAAALRDAPPRRYFQSTPRFADLHAVTPLAFQLLFRMAPPEIFSNAFIRQRQTAVITVLRILRRAFFHAAVALFVCPHSVKIFYLKACSRMVARAVAMTWYARSGATTRSRKERNHDDAAVCRSIPPAVISRRANPPPR
jgi:hypothetical protein